MSGAKPWDRPWSMDEIIENSDSWNLAGDVALLNTLKAFADNLLTRTTEINNNLQNLTSSLSETSLQLNIAQNEFQSLRNSQFIESRVYEDDETLEDLVEAKAEEKEVDKSEEIRLAALKGLEVLETYFEKVEVSVSDSEDDDIDLPNFVLRPKDLYLERPLPYVIGSEEWHKTWHVGLEDSSSDSETEKVSDNFSESDSESELPIIPDRTQIKGTSDTSSEDLRTEPKNFANSSDSENSVPVQQTSNFAEELAAKLGHVIDQEYVNRRPIQKTPQYDNLFFDEPPPLDEPKGLFSGGKGLFDDDEATPPTPKPELRQPSKQDLFDSDDDDDFFTKKNTSYLQNPVKLPLFSDEPPVLDDTKVVKPVGGVSIFGGGDLFDKKLLRRQPSSDEEENEKTPPKGRSVNLFEEEPSDEPVPDDKFVKPVGGILIFGGGDLFDKKLLRRQPSSNDEEENEASPPKGRGVNLFEEEPSVKTKKITLFDDDDDLFKDDLFSSNTTKKFTSGLFDDDLFTQTKPETKNSTDLFADLMAIPDDKNSINVDRRETEKEAESPKPKPRLSLFEPDDLFASTPAKALFDPSPPSDHETTNQVEGPPRDDVTTNPVEDEESKEVPPPLDAIKTNKPGKLKHNLNINVGALRPGSLPPKRTDGVTNATEARPRDHNMSLDEADNVTVLPSVTKDRARRPLNRRPSTRKGRKEALKKSEQENNTSRDPIFEVKSDKNDSNSAQENLNRFEEPPDDDLFETESQKTDVFVESHYTFAVKTKPNLGLFDEPPDDDFFEKSDTKENLFDETSDDLFDIKRDSPKKDSNRSLGLFEEPPDDLFESRDDIFEVKSETKPSRGIFEVNSEVKPSRDDIFDVQNEPKLSRDMFEVKSEIKPSHDDIFEVQNEPKPSRDMFEVKSEVKPSRDDIFEVESEAKPSRDIFDDPPDLFEVRAGKSAKNEPKGDLGLFDEVSDDDLFGNRVESEVKSDESRDIPKSQSSQVKSDIFGDEDDDDDLFNVKKMPIQSNKTKKSLFDDEDDDDIFKSFSSASVKKPESKVATEKKVPKVSTKKKLENTKPDDDPLSALLQ